MQIQNVSVPLNIIAKQTRGLMLPLPIFRIENEWNSKQFLIENRFPIRFDPLSRWFRSHFIKSEDKLLGINMKHINCINMKHIN